MDIFLEVKCIVRILYFVALFGLVGVEAVQFDCIKSDVCSCKTNSKPPQEMSIWSIPSHNRTEAAFTDSKLYAINLCHGVNKNTNAADGGCQNSTVCQYEVKNETNTFEIGHFGNVTFGKYDNESKSITLLYHGIRQQNVVRSMNITLKCNGSVTDAKYSDVYPSMFTRNLFTTTITTKAACLRPVVVPKTTSKPTTSKPTLKPTTSKSSTSKPSTSKPSPSKPSTSKPATSKPLTSKPATSKPSTSKPATSKLSTSKPSTLKPSTSKPSTSKPSTSKPSTSKSKTTTLKPTTSKPTSKSSSKPSNSSTLKPTAHRAVTSNGGLKTVYIALIVVAVLVIVLGLGFYVAHKMVVKRNRGYGVLSEVEENQDFGTVL